MDWDALLAEFRALGGIAENVTLRQGPRGRGLFAADPARPVRLLAPPNLLVPCEDTEIQDGRLVVKPTSSVGAREREFFNCYQREFSWGAGVFDDLWQAQIARNQLPQNVRRALLATWPLKIDALSDPSSEGLCHKEYLRTRKFEYRENSVLVPIVELVNHGRDAEGFNLVGGVGIAGNFSSEVLAAYGGDCWGTAMNHGFCEARYCAYAVRGSLRFEDHCIEISRALGQVEQFNGCSLPVVRVEGDTIHFSFVLLGDERFPHIPRAAFIHVTKNTPLKNPDKLFDLIQHYNRSLMLRFLRGSEGSETPLVTMLRNAGYQQLETLSCHWGTGPLEQKTARKSGTRAAELD
ncbi:MAG: hypothetical protein ABI608_00165 [Rhizomicrobium sp.]